MLYRGKIRIRGIIPVSSDMLDASFGEPETSLSEDRTAYLTAYCRGRSSVARSGTADMTAYRRDRNSVARSGTAHMTAYRRARSSVEIPFEVSQVLLEPTTIYERIDLK